MPFYAIEFKRCIIDYAALLIDEGNLDAGQPDIRRMVNYTLCIHNAYTHTHAQLLICITFRWTCFFLSQ